MNSQKLRETANRLNSAADHLDSSATAGGAFDWQGLITMLATVIPQVIALFTHPNQNPPSTGQ